ncbi:MAG: T9SS type A sorting domain-containing protein [Chitinophagales bacterium]
MRAENSFCAGTADDPSLNGFTLWGFDNTVWYTFIGPASGAVRVEVDGNLGIDGDEFAPQVVVYESSDGTCLGTMFDLKATPTISSGFSTSANMDVNCLNTGQTYFIAVDGGPLVSELFDINGYFEVKVTEISPTEFPPSNNDICDAKFINPFAATVSISNDTNRCANREFNIPEPSTFTRDHTVWYSFTTPAGPGPYAVEVEVNSQLGFPFGDAVDPQIAVYRSSNNTCNGTIVEHYSDYNTLGLPFTETSQVHCLDPATTYWIMVDGSALNSQGYFDITVQSISPNPIAVNNNICDLTNLGDLGASFGSTLGGTAIDRNNFCSDVEPGEVVPNAFGLDQTVWFSFRTPILASPGDGVNVDIVLLSDPNGIGDIIDLQVALYQSSDQSCTGILTEIESAYNPLGFDESLNDICLKQNTRYFIQVDGGINVQGYFTIEITNDGSNARPANDDFCNAQSLVLGATVNGNNTCATLESAEPNAGLGAQKTVWYSFVAPASGRVEIRTIDNDGLFGIDPEWRLYAFDGSCSGGIFTGSFDQLANNYTPLLDDVEDYECLYPGRVYYIQVDGTVGVTSDFQIRVSDLDPTYGTIPGPPVLADPEPVNNSCDNAIGLTVQAESCQYASGTWQNENYGLPTRSIEDISCGSNCGEIWYSFQMPASGFAKIEGDDDFGFAGSNNSELVIAAYRGTCGSLSLIECDRGGFNQDADFSITGTPGEVIYLQVFDDGGDDNNEAFALCVSERCAADDCLDALLAADILGQGPQCFDVRDATGENISGGDSGYGVGGVYSDNPNNSVYFAFETDEFCWGYVLNITTSDVGNIGGFGGTELILSVYEDDGTPCSHNPLGEPLLDIQAFDNATYPAGVNYTITYYVGNGVNNIKTNKRYIIQIEGNNSTADGTIEVKKLCEGRVWAYPSAAQTSSTGYCFDGTWRHYYNDAGTPSNPNDDLLIFSLRPNGNVFDGVATINLDAAPGFAENPGVEASWSMRRHWDFDVLSGSIVNPVDIRFYYQDSEKQEIINLAQTYALNHGLNYEAFEWFKSANGTTFNPSAHVTPPIVIAGYGSGSGPSITGDVIVQATAVGQVVVCQDHDADATNEFCNGVQYVDYLGLTGFSGGTGATGAGPGGSPLPVELLYFEGEKKDNGNVLKWASATEINNDFYELQHSVDGVVFSPIAIVPGAGNSSSVLQYETWHAEPANGYNYYRLKNVDFDGSYELSEIVILDNTKEEKDESMILLLYPNPSAANQINLDAYIAKTGNYRIEVYDLLGKLAFSQMEYLMQGNNTLALSFAGVASGSYFVEMIDLETQERVKKKFVRTN